MDDAATQMSPGGGEVARAVERLAAARIGRALPSLALLAVYGLVQSVRFGFGSADYLVVFLGALLSAASMVAYGTEAVNRVIGTKRPWSGLIHRGSLVPYLFGGYLFVTRALQLMRPSDRLNLGDLVVTLALMLVAVFCIRSHWKLTEVHLLAREMSGLAKVGPQ